MMMRISRFYSGIERSPREGIYWAFALLAVLLLNPARAIENESLSIRLNTIGYLPGTEKQAAIAAICTNFTVLRLADNATVFTGKVTSPALDSDTPEQLCTADFSKLKNPGDHPLAVPGGLSFGK